MGAGVVPCPVRMTVKRSWPDGRETQTYIFHCQAGDAGTHGDSHEFPARLPEDEVIAWSS